MKGLNVGKSETYRAPEVKDYRRREAPVVLLSRLVRRLMAAQCCDLFGEGFSAVVFRNTNCFVG